MCDAHGVSSKGEENKDFLSLKVDSDWVGRWGEKLRMHRASGELLRGERHNEGRLG